MNAGLPCENDGKMREVHCIYSKSAPYKDFSHCDHAPINWINFRVFVSPPNLARRTQEHSQIISSRLMLLLICQGMPHRHIQLVEFTISMRMDVKRLILSVKACDRIARELLAFSVSGLAGKTILQLVNFVSVMHSSELSNRFLLKIRHSLIP